FHVSYLFTSVPTRRSSDLGIPENFLMHIIPLLGPLSKFFQLIPVPHIIIYIEVGSFQNREILSFVFRFVLTKVLAISACGKNEEDRKSTRLNSSHVSISYA